MDLGDRELLRRYQGLLANLKDHHAERIDITVYRFRSVTQEVFRRHPKWVVSRK